MKFSVGYKILPDNEFINYIIKNKDKVYEVYFSWGDFPNGRNNQLVHENFYPWQALQKQIDDLHALSDGGVSLNLLLNGNCYGKYSLSRALFLKIGDTVDYINSSFGLASVTTTSPVIAKFIKSNFPHIKTRASINMEIGTVCGMDYISEYFDGYYLRREYNRNITAVKRAKKWCDENGKELFMLANSGCLNFCSAHTFHDNIVAHESEISEMDNAYEFKGQCWDYLSKKEKQISVLRDMSYIRPEDVELFDGYFTSAKLATRVSQNPVRTLRAYFDKSYTGAITDILEPSHTSVLYPEIVENKNIPEDFTKTVMSCDKNCGKCGYCAEVFENAKVNLEKY